MLLILGCFSVFVLGLLYSGLQADDDVCVAGSSPADVLKQVQGLEKHMLQCSCWYNRSIACRLALSVCAMLANYLLRRKFSLNRHRLLSLLLPLHLLLFLCILRVAPKVLV